MSAVAREITRIAGVVALGAALLAGCNVRGWELPPLGPAPGEDAGARPPGPDGDLFPSPGDAALPAADAPAGPQPDAPGGAPPDAPTSCRADLRSDPANCGRCGQICTFANAQPLCAGGACARGACLPGFHDFDGKPETGCEYACTPTNDGQELCDGRDNDCDGKTDEETDKTADPEHCGACGNRCALLHATSRCAAGACAIAACEGEFRDANGVAADGCECQVTNGGIEVCDGFDNDCNGKLDDVPASAFTSDAQNCGACRRNCTALPHAVGACEQSGCVVLACEFGHRDVDKKVENGCEQTCPGGFEGGIEVCDGVDNDCDGKVDAADDDLVAIENVCEQKGACAGAKPVCAEGRWSCSYGTDVQTTGPNQIVGEETRCDGKDNDCDGCIDEPFVEVGRQPAAAGGTCAATPPQACGDDKIGACRSQGTYVCAGDQAGVVCKITTPGAAPAAEVCNGADDDCDGVVDNADPADPNRIKEPMVAISGGALSGTVYVYAYEASRPDATATSAGASKARACAKPGAIPWTNVTLPEAAAACKAAGKRLCTEAEWQRACETAAAPACAWSFGSACTTAASEACNVHERDGDPATAGDQDALAPTGSLAACHAAWPGGKIFDLTGNVKEWTQPRSSGKNPVRGGAYDTVLSGATCSFDFVVLDDAFRFSNTGFRCCADAP